MPRTHAAYPPEYRRRIIELVCAGREPEALQADRGARRREDGLSSAERQELTCLR